MIRIALSALLFLGACAERETPVPMDDLRRDAEQGLRALGEGRFEVVEWRPLGGERFSFVDDYFYQTSFYALDFDARVRCSARLSVPDREELDGRVGEPGWSIEDSDRGLEMIELLGAGQRRAGETVDAHAAAIFDEMAPGRFRFHGIDRRRPAAR